MGDRFLIYGATGYTGKLLVRHAVERGLTPIVAGRNPEKVNALAAEHGLEARAFPLNDPMLSDRLSDVRCVLHSAGPFSATARQMINACLAVRAHYLDVTGELTVFELAESLDAQAKAAGVMLMPGVGFDVVPSDCLAAHVAARVDNPQTLRIGIGHAGGGPSRGSLKTGIEIMSQGLTVRRSGKLVHLPIGSLSRAYDFGAGPVDCTAMSMGDLVTAWHSTSIPNIEVYMQSAPSMSRMMVAMRYMGGLFRMKSIQDFMKRRVDSMPEGPTELARETGRSFVVAEATGKDGKLARSRLTTPSGYKMTALTGIEIAKRVMSGDARPGFQPPATYGPDYVLGLQSQRVDLN